MPAWKWQQRQSAFKAFSKEPDLEIRDMVMKDIEPANIESGTLDLSKPFVVDAKGSSYLEIKTPKAMREFTDWETVDTDLITDWAKKNGYDGVIIKNVLEGKGASTVADTYAIFDPSKFVPKSRP